MLLWLFPVIFATLYGLIAGVEFFLPLAGLLDSSEATQKIVARWFSPAWEVTNVFFVAAITSFAALFPLLLPEMPNSLRLWLLSSGALLALRAALVLIYFYARSGKGRVFLSILALVSLLLPVAFSQAVLALIAPGGSAAQALGAALIGLSLAAALCSGLFYGLVPSRRHQHATQLGWGVAAVSFLLLKGSDQSLASVGIVFGCAALGAILVSALSRHRWALLGLSGAVCAVLAVELSIRQWPYVIFGETTYQSVQAPQAIQAVIAWGSLVGLLILLPALIWFGLVVVRQHREVE